MSEETREPRLEKCSALLITANDGGCHYWCDLPRDGHELHKNFDFNLEWRDDTTEAPEREPDRCAANINGVCGRGPVEHLREYMTGSLPLGHHFVSEHQAQRLAAAEKRIAELFDGDDIAELAQRITELEAQLAHALGDRSE